MSIKLIIGCCNYLFGEGLKKLLDGDRDVNIIGIFNKSTDIKEITKLNPDLILAQLVALAARGQIDSGSKFNQNLMSC